MALRGHHANRQDMARNHESLHDQGINHHKSLKIHGLKPPLRTQSRPRQVFLGGARLRARSRDRIRRLLGGSSSEDLEEE